MARTVFHESRPKFLAFFQFARGGAADDKGSGSFAEGLFFAPRFFIACCSFPSVRRFRSTRLSNLSFCDWASAGILG